MVLRLSAKKMALTAIGSQAGVIVLRCYLRPIDY